MRGKTKGGGKTTKVGPIRTPFKDAICKKPGKK